MHPHDADRVRGEMLESWEAAAPAWGRRAASGPDWGLPVASWMIHALELHPGQRVLELAAGPGEVGFLAAELVRPGGVLVSSDGVEGMVAVARERAQALGIDNVEFLPLQLEWIDLPAASVDAILCRWGLMFALDPDAAAHEMRRVLRPAGRVAIAVWDTPEANPWMTIPQRALIELGYMESPDPDLPGPFSLASPDRLIELLEDAGFGDVVVDAVPLSRLSEDVDQYIAQSRELSGVFGRHWSALDAEAQARVRARIHELAAPYVQGPDGPVELPGRSLVAAASA